MPTKRPVVYLIGSIDSSKNPEEAFDYVEKQISALGHEAINPVKNEPTKTGMDVKDSLQHLRNLWRTGKIEEFVDIMKKVWICDLKAVQRADYLVLHFEPGDSGVGTFLEMTIASIQALLTLLASVSEEQDKAYIKVAKHTLGEAGLVKKPIYWVCTGATSDINTTLKFLVYVSGGQVFDTYRALCEHLKKEYGVFELPNKEEGNEK